MTIYEMPEYDLINHLKETLDEILDREHEAGWNDEATKTLREIKALVEEYEELNETRDI